MFRAVVDFLLLSLFCSVFAVTAGSARAEPIRVGIYQNAPKAFLDHDGRPSGFFPDILGEIAAEEGWTLTYVPCEWDACLDRLERGDLDLMMDVAYSRERADRFDFNHEIVLSSWSAIYVAAGSSIATLADIKGRRIAVMLGSIQHAAFREWMLAAGVRPEFILTQSNREVLEAVRDGRADGGVVNTLFGGEFAANYSLRRTDIVLAPSPLHFVTRRGGGGAILEAIDGHLTRMKDDPASPYQTALEKWIVPRPERKLPSWVVWALGGGGAVLILAVSFAAALKWRISVKTAALRRTNAMLNALIAVNESLIRSKGEQELLDRLCRAVIDQKEFFMAAVAFVDHAAPDGFQIVARHCIGDLALPEKHCEWSGVLLRGGPLDVAVRESRPVVGQEIACENIPNSLPALRAAGHGGKVTASAFPLIIDGRTIGGFCLCSGRFETFTRHMAELLEQMANDLAFGLRGLREGVLSKEMDKRIRQVEKMDALGDLAGGIAHDLKNMLFPIISLTRMALDDLPKEDRNHLRLEKVVEAAERAKSLTEKIHAFSHKDEGETERTSVCELIDGCLNILRPAVPSSIDIKVECRLGGEDAAIVVDPAQFQTMLLNLASNAADAIGIRTGRIAVEVQAVDLESLPRMDVPVPKLGPYVLLNVSDTGKGMDEETMRRVFEPYFTTKERGKGTGLGMAMVEKFIVRHGGGIALSSVPGLGTRFQIYLPRAESSIGGASSSA